MHHQGLGTDEDALIEICCTRNSAEMEAINKKYKESKITFLFITHVARS